MASAEPPRPLSARLLPQQVRYSRHVQTEQTVRRWAHKHDAVMPEPQVQRMAKFLNDWAR